jgi:putative phosphoribosyl transferase
VHGSHLLIGAYMAKKFSQKLVYISDAAVVLEGGLAIPEDAGGLVLFAHGSGSSRHSPRNKWVAEVLHGEGLATLLFDLLSREEDSVYATRFDIELLTRRLKAATEWALQQAETKSFAVGYFGASTGAAAALIAAAELGHKISAVVSRGGRPDLALASLSQVLAPTLLIVGGHDYQVIELNEQAYKEIKAEKELAIVPGATHLFEEPGALDEVARLASAWFKQHLGQKL